MCVCVCVHMLVCTCVYVSVYVCVCVCVCVCVSNVNKLRQCGEECCSVLTMVCTHADDITRAMCMCCITFFL